MFCLKCLAADVMLLKYFICHDLSHRFVDVRRRALRLPSVCQTVCLSIYDVSFSIFAGRWSLVVWIFLEGAYSGRKS